MLQAISLLTRRLFVVFLLAVSCAQSRSQQLETGERHTLGSQQHDAGEVHMLSIQQVDDRLASARRLVAERKPDQYAPQFLSYLKDYPFSETRFEFIEALILHACFGEAGDQLKASKVLLPIHWKTMLCDARLYNSVRNSAAAIQVLDSAIAKFPNRPLLFIERAEALSRVGRTADAVLDLRQAARHGELPAEARMMLLGCLAALNRIDEAVELLDGFPMSGMSSSAQRFFAAVLLGKQNWSKAGDRARAAQEAAKNVEDLEAALLTRLHALVGSGEDGQASEVYKELTKRVGSAPASVELAKIWCAFNKYDSVATILKDACDEAIAGEKASIEVLYMGGASALRTGSAARAALLLELALKEEFNTRIAIENALALADSGEQKKALEQLAPIGNDLAALDLYGVDVATAVHNLELRLYHCIALRAAQGGQGESEAAVFAGVWLALSGLCPYSARVLQQDPLVSRQLADPVTAKMLVFRD